jgi:hypothetical protein
MRIPNEEHTGRSWRIHEVAPDFRLEDVWELPGVGGPDDFPRLVEAVAAFDADQVSSIAARALFAVRTALGKILRLDEPSAGAGSRAPTLRDRLPADLRDGPRGPRFTALPFSSLYLTEDEWAAEAANRTMHGVLHFARVPNGDGGFTFRMAVLVQPNGLTGQAYMAFIKPFRYLVVYPALMRAMSAAWRASQQERV